MTQTTSKSIAIADIVVCRDGDHARAFDVTGRAGIAVEARKSDARISFLHPSRSIWLPLASIRRATAEEAEASGFGLARDLAHALSGVAIEIEEGRTDPQSIRVVVTHGAIDTARLDELRRRFQGRIGAWALRPAGLHKIESVIELSPPSA